MPHHSCKVKGCRTQPPPSHYLCDVHWHSPEGQDALDRSARRSRRNETIVGILGLPLIVVGAVLVVLYFVIVGNILGMVWTILVPVFAVGMLWETLSKHFKRRQ